MKKLDPRLSIITLGVADLARSREFYINGLGFPAFPDKQEEIVFLQLNGFALALYPREKLAEDAYGDNPPPQAQAGATPPFTLAYNVRSEAEVATTLAFAEQAGGKLIKPAQKVFWGGVSGYFTDPDGFLWEVAYNPHTPLDADGNFIMQEAK